MSNHIQLCIQNQIHQYIHIISTRHHIPVSQLQLYWDQLDEPIEPPPHTVASTPTTTNPINFHKMKTNDLKDLCKQYNLKAKGNKKQMIDSIMTYVASQSETIEQGKNPYSPFHSKDHDSLHKLSSSLITDEEEEEEDYDFGSLTLPEEDYRSLPLLEEELDPEEDEDLY